MTATSSLAASATGQRCRMLLGQQLEVLRQQLLGHGLQASLVDRVTVRLRDQPAVVLLLAREISITGLRSIASTEGLIMASIRGGKLKTALQMIGILCLIIGYPYHLSLGVIDLGMVDLVLVGRTLVYISLFFSLTSAFEYVSAFNQALESREKE